MTAVPSRRALLGLGWLRVPHVEPAACLARTGCGICVERCPIPGAMALAADAPVIDADACDRCGVCTVVCPSPTPCIVLG